MWEGGTNAGGWGGMPVEHAESHPCRGDRERDTAFCREESKKGVPMLHLVAQMVKCPPTMQEPWV